MKRQIIVQQIVISLDIFRLICQFSWCKILSFLPTLYQPHITKILQQNSEWGQQVCTGTVSEQHFSELLSSSLVERLLLTLEVPRFES